MVGFTLKTDPLEWQCQMRRFKSQFGRRLRHHHGQFDLRLFNLLCQQRGFQDICSQCACACQRLGEGKPVSSCALSSRHPGQEYLVITSRQSGSRAEPRYCFYRPIKYCNLDRQTFGRCNRHLDQIHGQGLHRFSGGQRKHCSIHSSIGCSCRTVKKYSQQHVQHAGSIYEFSCSN